MYLMYSVRTYQLISCHLIHKGEKPYPSAHFNVMRVIPKADAREHKILKTENRFFFSFKCYGALIGWE